MADTKKMVHDDVISDVPLQRCWDKARMVKLNWIRWNPQKEETDVVTSADTTTINVGRSQNIVDNVMKNERTRDVVVENWSFVTTMTTTTTTSQVVRRYRCIITTMVRLICNDDLGIEGKSHQLLDNIHHLKNILSCHFNARIGIMNETNTW